MRRIKPPDPFQLGISWLVLLAVAAPLLAPTAAAAQDRGMPDGEWHFQSGDTWGTRYSPLDQIHAGNFEDLEVAWIFRGDNFSPTFVSQSRSTPSYVDGILYTVAGSRRTVVAMDPATGETLWTFREPHTTRWERSMRASYGKGISYGEVDGRGVVFISTPAFFLWALDAKTGRPLEGWGTGVDLPGFETGVVDLVADLMEGWGPWENWEGEGYDPDFGVPRELGFITSSSPPIFVNGTVVVGNSAEQGYNQTRVEMIPGDILAYDARTGEYKWKFHVIPRPGEFGHETWENDAWAWTGDVSSWAPMSADPVRNIVYIPTNPPTIDYFGGFRPGANLFGTSVIALDVDTGERVWHFQTVHNDQWNYDLPNVPILADLNVNGQEIPALIQTSKQGLIFTFNRETGEPVWPIEDRPVFQTEVPGNWTSPTQPFPTWPEPFEPIAFGLTEEHVIDFTPELRAEALEIMSQYRVGDLYMPRLHVGHDLDIINNIRCGGGLNITNPATFDPTTNILYVSHGPGCGGGFIMPGIEADLPDAMATTGTTISEWVAGPGGGLPQVQGLPIFKPPYNRLSAYDMNTGERIWWIPVGEPADNIVNHPALQGVDTSTFGGGGRSIQMVTGSLLVTTGFGQPILRAHDKRTGEHVGDVEIPVPGQYGMMSYEHDGVQYIVVQIGGPDYPGSLVALRLP
jgi:glucose dehydrogenase